MPRAVEPHPRAELAVLLGRVAEGDRAAFATLYRRTSGKLFGTAIAIMRRRDSAEDVVQEAFLRIWKSAGQYRPGRGAAITWMAAIVRNLAIDKLRSAALERHEDMSDDIAADLPDPVMALADRDDEARLARAIAALDPDKRALLVAAYIRGESRAELAKRFNAPVNTIKTWLHRMVAELRAMIEAERETAHAA
jgi:RNA polymerase sigma-70 factor, ECF subfamily